jgi:hypothetical protein
VIDPFQPGERVRFDGERRTWLVRATACEGRYAIATSNRFGTVLYTIIDRDENVRGPLNTLGGGLGIKTTSGPDPEIDAAVARLEGAGEWGSQWKVSERNRVPLVITERQPA